MKLRSLAMTMILGTCGLLAASGPSFALPVLCSTVTTVGAWAGLGAAGCLDQDADSVWVWTGGTVASNVVFSVTELEVSGVDFYTLALNWPVGTSLTTSATLSFSATSLNTEQFVAANFGTTLSEAQGTSGATASAVIGPGSFLTLTSTDGSQAPPSGETPFAAHTAITVTDTFNPGAATPAGTALLTGADNSFQIATPQTNPEPATLLLFGAGLAGLGLFRRRKSS